MPGAAPILHIREANEDDLQVVPAASPDLLGPEPGRRRIWVAERGEGQIASLRAELHRVSVGRDALPSARIELDLHTLAHPFVRSEPADSPASSDPAQIGAALMAAARRALAEAGVVYLYRLAPAIPPTDARPPSLTAPSPSPSLTRALGLRGIGRYIQRTKPARPLTVAAARLGHPRLLARAAGSLDRILSLPMRAPGWQPRQLPRGHSFVELDLDLDAAAIVGLLDRAGRDRVTRRWDRAALLTAYGPRAQLLGLTHAGVIAAFVAYRLVERRDGLDLAEILDLVARDDDPRLCASLLRATERRVRERVDALTLLDASGPGLSQAARAAGYLDAGLRWTLSSQRLDPSQPPLPPGARWRLGLIDALARHP